MKTHVKDRNSQHQKAAHLTFAKDFAHLLANEKTFIYVDETGFNSALMPIYGYSQIGKRCYYKGKPKGSNYSVVAAITQDEFMGFKIIEGSVQYNDFAGFLIDVVKKYPDILVHRAKYYFVMDNASSHHAKNFRPFRGNLNILFNAPYSPFHNPIEEMFGLWKFPFRKTNFSGDESVAKSICSSAKLISNTKLEKFFMHSLEYIACSLKQGDIL